MNDTLAFYEAFAGDYHLIFKDWQIEVRHQSQVLHDFIQRFLPQAPLAILDCSCGIGTQAIALALHGYRVHATDLSPASVERAAQEAERFGVSLTTGVADFRTLEQQVEGQFDMVLSADNAIPHLLTDDDLQVAAQNMYAKLRPGGLLFISIRDYDRLIQEKPRQIPLRIFDSPAGRRIVFQVWDWAEDAPIYRVSMFMVRQQADGTWLTTEQATHYRALQRDELTGILMKENFEDIEWHMPVDSGFYQPVVTARKP